MLFHVYAGSMFCGRLLILADGSQAFRPRDGGCIRSVKTVTRVAGYKKLTLERKW